MHITHIFNDHSHQGDLFCVHSLILRYKKKIKKKRKNRKKSFRNSDFGKIVITTDSVEVTKYAVM